MNHKVTHKATSKVTINTVLQKTYLFGFYKSNSQDFKNFKIIHLIENIICVWLTWSRETND